MDSWWGPTFNTGGKYNPSTDSWTATSTSNAPDPRNVHTALWSGTQMIVWGGWTRIHTSNTGGRSDPSTNSWTATSNANAPEQPTFFHRSLDRQRNDHLGWRTCKYSTVEHRWPIQPRHESWTATSIGNAPDARSGSHGSLDRKQHDRLGWALRVRFQQRRQILSDIDLWVSTNTTNAPFSRSGHTAVWTGSEMVVCGRE